MRTRTDELPPLEDEHGDYPFEITARRQNILTAICAMHIEGHPFRSQIIVPRRMYGKSRLMREIQRNPTMVPCVFDEHTKIAIISSERTWSIWPDHFGLSSGEFLVPVHTITDNYDAIVFDDCLFNDQLINAILKISDDFPCVPMIIISSTEHWLRGFHMWHSPEIIDSSGFGHPAVYV